MSTNMQFPRVACDRNPAPVAPAGSNPSAGGPSNAGVESSQAAPAGCSRRRFLQAAAAAGIGLNRGPAHAAAPIAPQPLALGLDNFAVRAMNWKAQALLEYAARLQLDSLFITDLFAFESLEDGHLRELRQRAVDQGIALIVGSWSICPTSLSFKTDWGNADEHLALGLRVAAALGSPVFRVILGSRRDRMTEGGIEGRIADTVRVLKAARSRALDLGLKIAVENHAGDMHSTELVRLIEEAGSDYVGANLDAGNATWTLEDPLDNLENLGRYTVSTSLRDSAMWESENGVTIQWTAMGEGVVDWKKYFARFAELCPEVPVNIETISGFNHELPVNKEDYWQAWPQGKPPKYDRFLALARDGRPRSPHQHPAGGDRQAAEQKTQQGEFERSVRYCRELGLGRKR
jgi:sugar phosphate isomerase/epimerase